MESSLFMWSKWISLVSARHCLQFWYMLLVLQKIRYSHLVYVSNISDFCVHNRLIHIDNEKLFISLKVITDYCHTLTLFKVTDIFKKLLFQSLMFVILNTVMVTLFQNTTRSPRVPNIAPALMSWCQCHMVDFWKLMSIAHFT